MNNTVITKELLKEENVEIETEKNNTAFPGETLHEAAEMGNVRRLELLMKLGLSIESRDHKGYTPLHSAASTGQLEVAEFLISKNCDINAKAKYGETPILVASVRRKKDMVNLLTNYGADLNGSTSWDNNKTVLYIACEHNWIDTVLHLLQSGKVNIDAKDGDGIDGWTPLCIAMECLHFDVARLLLQYGANVDACSDEGETPLYMACLYSAEATEDTDGRHLDAELIKLMLEAGADANFKSRFNETPFHLLIENKEPNLEVIKLMIEHGAYFRYTDNEKITNNNWLKEFVLQDVELCTQLLINKFDRHSLPAVYNNPEFLKKLPRIMDRMNIEGKKGMRKGIAGCVEFEIATKTYCNVMMLRPTVLTLMCVEALIN